MGTRRRPQGAIPEAMPFTPIIMPDMAGLSPQARHEVGEMVRVGGDSASFEAWASRHAQQNAGGSPAARNVDPGGRLAVARASGSRRGARSLRRAP
jgi:hypothetical protein